MKQKEAELKTAEAFQTDVGYGRARIDSQTISNLDLSKEDVIEIEGAKITAAIVYPAHHTDEDKGIIRIDDLTIKNAGAMLGETVKIRKAEARNAEMLTIGPLISKGQNIQFGSGIEFIIKKGLRNRPLKKDDSVIIPGIALFGVNLPFMIINTTPSGIVTISEETKIKVKEINLNPSEIAENELKEHMSTTRSTVEKAPVDFNSFLKTLEKEDRCYFLPFELKKIHIKNIGIHSNLELNFDSFNVIEGIHGVGKTTVIRCIAKTFGYDTTSYHKLLSPDQNPHQISITIKPENKIDITFDEKNQDEFNEKRTTKCIIMDEPTSRLSSNLKKEFLQYLQGLNTQIILTSTPDDKIKLPYEFRFSRLT